MKDNDVRDGSMCVHVVCIVPRCTVRSGRVILKKKLDYFVYEQVVIRVLPGVIYMIFYNMYNKKFAPQSAKNQKNTL